MSLMMLRIFAFIHQEAHKVEAVEWSLGNCRKTRRDEFSRGVFADFVLERL